jgi:hypothetical protein
VCWTSRLIYVCLAPSLSGNEVHESGYLLAICGDRVVTKSLSLERYVLVWLGRAAKRVTNVMRSPISCSGL